MNFRTIKITPALADYILQFNSKNRPLRKKNLDYWKMCIRTNSVTPSHQGIALSGTIETPSRLLDGQHRLAAIKETGISCEFVVAEEVPIEAYQNFDNGLSRAVTDRAEVSKIEATLSSSLYYAYNGIRSRPPIALLKEICVEIGPHCELICKNNARSLGCAGIRMAWVIQQAKFGNNSSHSFTIGRFENMSPALCSFYRRQVNSRGRLGGYETLEVFCLAWKAIINPDQTRFITPSDPQKMARSIILENLQRVAGIIEKYTKKGGLENELR